MTRMPALLSFLVIYTLAISSEVRAQDCQKARELVVKGLAISEQKSQEEEELYKEALTLCPDLVEAKHNLALLLLRRKQYAESIELLNQAMNKRSDPRFRLALASAYIGQKDYDRADSQYVAMIEAGEERTIALQGRAFVAQQKKDDRKALQFILDALEHQPQDQEILFKLGIIYERLQMDDEARHAYERALQGTKPPREALMRLSFLLEKSGEFEEAYQLLRKQIHSRERDTELLHLLGVLARRTDRTEEAMRSFQRALEIESDQPEVAVNLAILFLEKGNAARALDVLSPFSSSSELSARYYAALGWAQLETGKTELAKVSLKNALERDPTHETARDNLKIAEQRLGVEHK